MSLDGNLLEHCVALAQQAGESILKHYSSDSTSFNRKADHSPVTEADLEANQIITQGLKDLEFPIISEEDPILPYSERKKWDRFWLVDPLDGTKEFLKRNGEFTVNIALIENGVPTIGIIHIPVTHTTYFGSENGSYKLERTDQSGSKPERIYSELADPHQELTLVESRSAPSSGDHPVLKDLRIKERIHVGSSIKFCWLAEQKADVYFRIARSMEWDVAAGDGIYRFSSRSTPHPSPFTYNKEILENGPFLLGL